MLYSSDAWKKNEWRQEDPEQKSLSKGRLLGRKFPGRPFLERLTMTIWPKPNWFYGCSFVSNFAIAGSFPTVTCGLDNVVFMWRRATSTLPRLTVVQVTKACEAFRALLNLNTNEARMLSAWFVVLVFMNRLLHRKRKSWCHHSHIADSWNRSPWRTYAVRSGVQESLTRWKWFSDALFPFKCTWPLSRQGDQKNQVSFFF